MMMKMFFFLPQQQARDENVAFNGKKLNIYPFICPV